MSFSEQERVAGLKKVRDVQGSQLSRNLACEMIINHAIFKLLHTALFWLAPFLLLTNHQAPLMLSYCHYVDQTFEK